MRNHKIKTGDESQICKSLRSHPDNHKFTSDINS